MLRSGIAALFWFDVLESLDAWAFANGWETASNVNAAIEHRTRHIFISLSSSNSGSKPNTPREKMLEEAENHFCAIRRTFQYFRRAAQSARLLDRHSFVLSLRQEQDDTSRFLDKSVQKCTEIKNRSFYSPSTQQGEQNMTNAEWKWEGPYLQAFLETNSLNLPGRITNAEKAIASRTILESPE